MTDMFSWFLLENMAWYLMENPYLTKKKKKKKWLLLTVICSMLKVKYAVLFCILEFQKELLKNKSINFIHEWIVQYQ